MADSVLGRTNRAFPPVWLSLSLPPGGGETAIDGLVGAARDAGVPIDISGNPALFGGRMRGEDDLFLTQVSTASYERANDDQHAGDLIQAHMIETLSAIGREWIDVYYLRVRQAVDEAQLSGALEAMEMARQEGHIRYLGLLCDGSSLATLGLWQFHDAFDLVLVPRDHADDEDYRTLAPLSRERRVGLVTYNPAGDLPISNPMTQAAVGDFSKDHPVLVKVRTAEEVALAIDSPSFDLHDLVARLKAVVA